MAGVEGQSRQTGQAEKSIAELQYDNKLDSPTHPLTIITHQFSPFRVH